MQGITQSSRPPVLGVDQLAFNTGAALAVRKPIGDGNRRSRTRTCGSPSPTRNTPRIPPVFDQWSSKKAASGKAADTIIPPLYANLHLTPATPYTYDPAKAQQLLDAAGYKVGPGRSARRQQRAIACRSACSAS